MNMAQNITVRGDTGLILSSGPPFESNSPNASQIIDTTKNCRVSCWIYFLIQKVQILKCVMFLKVMAFSNKGDYLAWSDGKSVTIVDLTKVDGQRVSLAVERTQFLEWSPQDNFLATWEVFAVRNGKQEPNMKLWDLQGQLKASFVVRKNEGWQPRWSKDEDLCAVRNANNEVAFYKAANFEGAPEKRLSLAKMDSFNVSPNGQHVVAFVPGQKGAPGYAKLFAYPAFNPEKNVIASKSFMLADKMEAQWSVDSRAVLLLMQTEVDKTGASYYGKSQLHFMDITGETAMVQMSKEGPIYHVAWSPKTKPTATFCVVYGFMPAKATLYNKKCEKVFDFGTGPRNISLFNAQGNLLLLGGFGNLRGNIEIWDVEAKKAVTNFEASDCTDIRWSPDGQHLLTSTCAPRLRVSNGYKVWHYTNTLLYETFYKDATSLGPGEELWEAAWRSNPSLKEKTFNILTSPIGGGVKPQQPQASKQAYVPPAARGKLTKSGEYKKFSKLHDEDELPENLKKKAEEEANLSKSAAKNKKRREAAAKKKQEDTTVNKAVNNDEETGSGNDLKLTGDPDKDKKIRNLEKKLLQIAKLRRQIKEGAKLEANQMEKMKREAELIAEMKQLQL
jgi:translation initiation factor 2A